MNSTINSIHQLRGNDLGSILDVFSAGAGLVDSFVDARADRKSDESDERQLQLQIAAERERAQMQDARLGKILKFAAVAGSVLLVGVVVVSVIKSDSPEVEMKPAENGSNGTGKLPILAGMRRKGRIKTVSTDRKSTQR